MVQHRGQILISVSCQSAPVSLVQIQAAPKGWLGLTPGKEKTFLPLKRAPAASQPALDATQDAVLPVPMQIRSGLLGS